MDKKILATLPGGYRTTISNMHQRLNHGINIKQILFGLSVLGLAVLLAACSLSPSPSTGTPTPTTIIGQLPLPVPTATPLPTSLQTLAATADPLDPCQLIGSQEASTFTGATFGPGQEETLGDGARLCTYGSETANVFLVEVAQAPDVATAQAYKADFLATIQANVAQLASGGLNVTELPDFADGATMGILSTSIGGVALNGSAIGVLKGTIFFGFSDEVKGGPAPTAAAVQSEATTLLGRLP